MPAPSKVYHHLCIADRSLRLSEKESVALYESALHSIKETLQNVGETIAEETLVEESDIEEYGWVIGTESGIFFEVRYDGLHFVFPVKTMWTDYLIGKIMELGFEESYLEDDSRLMS